MHLHMKKYEGSYRRNTLYKILEPATIVVDEIHKDDSSIDRFMIDVKEENEFTLLFANEYRANQGKNTKVPDVLFALWDENHHHMAIEVMDMKRNIMSFTISEYGIRVASHNISRYIEQMSDGYKTMKCICDDLDCTSSNYGFALATRYWSVEKFERLFAFMRKQKKGTSKASILKSKRALQDIKHDKTMQMIEQFMKKSFVIDKGRVSFEVSMLEEVEKKENIEEDKEFTVYLARKTIHTRTTDKIVIA